MLFLYPDFPTAILVVPDDLTHAGNLDITGQRIFNADYRCRDSCLHIRFFKAKFRVNHLTICQF